MEDEDDISDLARGWAVGFSCGLLTLAVLAALLSLAHTCHADDEVVISGGRLSKRVVVLVDASGSMAYWGGGPWGRPAPEGAPRLYDLALAACARLLADATDEQMVKVGVFGGEETPRWLTIPPNPGDPEDRGTESDGFARLPSRWVLRHVLQFLSAQKPDGGTPMREAVTWALLESQGPVDAKTVRRDGPEDLCIVVISDGIPDRGSADYEAIAEVAKDTPVFFVRVERPDAVDGERPHEDGIRAVVTRTGGSYMRTNR